MKLLVWLPIFTLSFLVACTSVPKPSVEPDCMSAQKIEQINAFTKRNRLFELDGENAKVFLALDPRLLSNEYAYSQLIKQDINKLIVWKVREELSLAAAVPFVGGCAVEGYGEPDFEEKLLLMHEATVLIAQKGLDTDPARKKIEELLAYEYHRAPDQDLYDKAASRIRDVLTQKKPHDAGLRKISAKSGGQTTPLHIAAEEGNSAAVEVLLKEGADVNARAKFGMTALHYAAGWSSKCYKPPCQPNSGVSEGHQAVVALLIAHGADVNAEGSDGSTPLMYAAACNAVDVTRLLIDHGADLNHRGSQYTALEMASARGPNAAILMIKRGAKVNTSDLYTKQTPLHTAASCGYGELVDVLLANGANLSAKNQHGNSPLDVAKDPRIIETLKRHLETPQ